MLCQIQKLLIHFQNNPLQCVRLNRMSTKSQILGVQTRSCICFEKIEQNMNCSFLPIWLQSKKKSRVQALCSILFVAERILITTLWYLLTLADTLAAWQKPMYYCNWIAAAAVGQNKHKEKKRKCIGLLLWIRGTCGHCQQQPKNKKHTEKP